MKKKERKVNAKIEQKSFFCFFKNNKINKYLTSSENRRSWMRKLFDLKANLCWKNYFFFLTKKFFSIKRKIQIFDKITLFYFPLMKILEVKL